MKTLKKLLDEGDIVSIDGNLDLNVSGICYDSRKIKKNNCFVAIRGFEKNGANYTEDAVERGANSVVSETKMDRKLEDSTWIQVRNDRLALSKMSARFYDEPSKDMVVIGVTGTNGKTTVVSLINEIFNKESTTAKIGTLGMSCDGMFIKSQLTTPEANEIFEFLSRCRELNCKNLVMEVSSVGIRLHRVEDIKFSQALFTTFSGDHLDFHKSMEAYFESKLLLFKKLSFDDWAVINIDDPYSSRIIDELDCHYLTYGFSDSADIRPLKFNLSMNGISGEIQTPRGKIDINSSLIGRVNLLNILAAMTSSLISGISSEHIFQAVKNFSAVKGRLDFVYNEDFSVIIDYAHTDNAMEALLRSLREIVSNRIILVFGAGGSRDKTKRPRMGAVASENSDFVVVTSDNPRSEDPTDIIDDIINGFTKNFTDYHIEVKREKAIQKALNMADTGDLVVIAGKGHEDYQIFKDKTIHFDDYEIVQKVLRGKSA